VLAFADDPAALTAARAAWSEAGLVPVDVEIAEYGVDGPASEAAARGLGANTEERT
jgi:hypothetical protein